MLKTVWLTEQPNKNPLENGMGTAMLLGGFDGLHLGHCKLLARAKESGLKVGVMTIVGGKEDENLFTFQERESIFKNVGIDFVFELPFSEIKDITPLEFVALLQKQFSPKLFVCGEDFRFGAKAQGTPEILKRATQVCVDVQPLVERNGQKVSSSYIKTLIKSGDVKSANELLCERFFLIGKVFEDRKIGRTLQFPTANIQYPIGKYSLKKGVYETRVTLFGKEYKGITNYGARPTFDNDKVLTETYLDGFDGDLYGRELKVSFVRYLRDIRKFDDIGALKKQLEEDIRRVREND